MDVEEFKRFCRETFSFLQKEYAFQEVIPTRSKKQNHDANPYLIEFKSPTTQLSIEGINWGFGISISFQSVDENQTKNRQYGIDLLLSLREPQWKFMLALYPDDMETQKILLLCYAQVIERNAQDILKGDFQVCVQLDSMIHSHQERYRKNQELWWRTGKWPNDE